MNGNRNDTFATLLRNFAFKPIKWIIKILSGGDKGSE